MPDGFDHLVVPPLVQVGEYQTSIVVSIETKGLAGGADLALVTVPPSARTPRRIRSVPIALRTTQAQLDALIEQLAEEIRPIADTDAAADLVRRGYKL